MNDEIYQKVGKRYKQIGHTFRGFPCNGFWVVKDGSQTCIQLMDTLPNKPIAMDHKRHLNEVIDVIAQAKNGNCRDIAKAVCDYFDGKLTVERKW